MYCDREKKKIVQTLCNMERKVKKKLLQLFAVVSNKFQQNC